MMPQMSRTFSYLNSYYETECSYFNPNYGLFLTLTKPELFDQATFRCEEAPGSMPFFLDPQQKLTNQPTHERSSVKT